VPVPDRLFSLVCGREHLWTLAGEPLPFCQRCTGLYVGGALAVLLLLLFRPRPTPLVLWVHGLLLLLMVPFGFDWIEQGPTVRTLTGQLFALGLIYYLGLAVALPLRLWSGSGPGHPRAYGLGALAGILALQAAVRVGGTATRALLTWTGAAGLAAYAVLLLANLIALPHWLWSARRHSVPAPSP
jgi:uncharacterized membrane protein